MSVYTSYEMESETNMLEKLKAINGIEVESEYDATEYDFDEKGKAHPRSVKRLRCRLDLSVLDPEEWKSALKNVCEKGVQTLNKVDFNYCRNEVARHLFKFNVPEQRMVYIKNAYEKNVFGYYTRNLKQDMSSSQFVPFTDEELASIDEIANKLLSMYKKQSDGWYRRDYLPSEIEDMAIYPIDMNADGKYAIYIRNYATWFDELPALYIAHALSDTKIHLRIVIENDLLYDGYSEDGKFNN